jgi:hypothetical protein
VARSRGLHILKDNLYSLLCPELSSPLDPAPYVREALDEAGAIFVLMKYYEPWLYRRHETDLSLGPT